MTNTTLLTDVMTNEHAGFQQDGVTRQLINYKWCIIHRTGGEGG